MYYFCYLVFASLYCACLSSSYMFYREMSGTKTKDAAAASRRSFGGRAAEIKEFPLVVVLLDKYWSTLCTGSAITLDWVVTAGHCVTDDVAYVKYNSRNPKANDGSAVSIIYLYRHPDYEAMMSTDQEGNNDVTLLRHDVGLISTRTPMKDLRYYVSHSLESALVKLQKFSSFDFKNREVVAYSFTYSNPASSNELLYSIRLQPSVCKRSSWYNCSCLVAAKDEGSLCGLDSGGPVVYEGVQVGIVSMGPSECVRSSSAQDETAVVMELSQYSSFINNTILDAERFLSVKRTIRSYSQGAEVPVFFIFLSSLLITLRKSIYFCF